MLFGKKKNSNPFGSPASGSVTTSSTNSVSANSPGKVCLTKSKDALERHVVQLKKGSGIDLTNHKARVFVVLDISGSMHTLFYDGSVQKTLIRLLPLALKFDDDGVLDVYVFNDSCKKMPSMNLGNYETYVEDVLIRNGCKPDGGTRYAPAIKKTVSSYNDRSPYPAFGIFITDGNNSDAPQTDKEIRNSSKYKIFYQFVGIGKSSFAYLEKLDNLTGRNVDNTAFVRVADFSKLSNDQLYEKLLEQYPQWLRAIG